MVYTERATQEVADEAIHHVNIKLIASVMVSRAVDGSRIKTGYMAEHGLEGIFYSPVKEEAAIRKEAVKGTIEIL